MAYSCFTVQPVARVLAAGLLAAEELWGSSNAARAVAGSVKSVSMLQTAWSEPHCAA
jgi:hypothetical protein